MFVLCGRICILSMEWLHLALPIFCILEHLASSHFSQGIYHSCSSASFLACSYTLHLLPWITRQTGDRCADIWHCYYWHVVAGNYLCPKSNRGEWIVPVDKDECLLWCCHVLHLRQYHCFEQILFPYSMVQSLDNDNLLCRTDGHCCVSFQYWGGVQSQNEKQ